MAKRTPAPAPQALQHPFIYSTQPIRTHLDDNGEPWFCARDVFAALDVAWRGTGSLSKCQKTWVRYFRTPRCSSDVLFIREPAVYQVAFSSRKPEATKFSNWVFSEVLPSLRKRGFYGKPTLTPAESIRLHNQKLKYLPLVKSSNAYVFTSALQSLTAICSALGEPMPDIALLNKKTGEVLSHE